MGGAVPVRRALNGARAPPSVRSYTLPLMRSPTTWPTKRRRWPCASVRPKRSCSPATLGSRTVVSKSLNATVAVKSWKCWRATSKRVVTNSSRCRNCSSHDPPTLAGTSHRCNEAGPTREVSSGSQRPMRNSCDTMRVPGLSASRRGRSLRFRCGSRYSVTTVAWLKSDSKMSAFSKRARSISPASRARRRDSSTRSALYSSPKPRAPSPAAASTILPSPDPRSTNWSLGVSCASLSMRVTSASGVAIHITSLPAWPRRGS